MSPPSSLLNRRSLVPSRQWPETEAPGSPAADTRAFLRASQLVRDSYISSGWDLLRQAAGPGSEGRLTEGVTACENQALAGDLRLFSAALRLRVTQLSQTEDPAEKENIREASRLWARRALPLILNSYLPSRNRALALHETVVALSSVLNPPNPEAALPTADRELLLSYFVQIRALIGQAALERESDSSLAPIPDYLGSYAQAQQALLDEPPQARAAFQYFLETRRRLAAAPSTWEFRARVAESTEAALLHFPRDTRGIQRENLRSYYALYALLLFDQVDGGNVQQAEALLAAVSERLQSHERGSNLRPLLEAMNSDASISAPIGQSILRILGSAEREPYSTIFRQDEDDRPLSRARRALESSPALAQSVSDALRAPAGASNSELVLLLSEYGPFCPDLLASLLGDPALSPAASNLSQSLHALSSDEETASRDGLELPLETMVHSLDGLAEREERYASAYAQILRDMSEGPGAATLPERLRQEAGRALSRLVDFNPSRLFRHLTSTESLLTLVAGVAMAELAPIAFLRWARNGGIFLRGGRLTWQAELAGGVGIGFATSTLGAIHHLSMSPRPLGTELGEMWPAFAINTIAGGLGMGGTMLAGRGLRHWLLPPGVATQMGMRTVALRGGTFLSGGTLMLGGHALGETALTGHWRTPSAEEAVETYASMALWDLGAAGLRQVGHRHWWRAQLGPHRARSEVDGLVHSLEQRNPWLFHSPAERRGLENYLGSRIATGRNLTEVYQGFTEDRVPHWAEGRLIFRPHESATSSLGEAAYPLTAEEWTQLGAMPMRDPARQILHDPRLRPIARVEAGNRTFYLSRILRAAEEGEVRSFVLALTPVTQDGVTNLRHRFFYLSGSDVGGWRASPATLGRGHILKGVRHYTQDTQVVPEILQTLTAMDRNRSQQLSLAYEELLPYIALSFDGGAGVRVSNLQRFQAELEFPSVQGLTMVRGLQPGQAFMVKAIDWGTALGRNAAAGGAAPSIVERLSGLPYPEGFIPDFIQEPRRIFTVAESLLGRLTFREYSGAYLVQSGDQSRSRPILWVMGEDSQGRAWVKWIRYADVEVNSFGIYQEVIDSGIVTSKPLEYFEQAAALPREYRPGFNGTYADITPALSLLRPIREYMAARGLPPREPQHD